MSVCIDSNENKDDILQPTWHACAGALTHTKLNILNGAVQPPALMGS